LATHHSLSTERSLANVDEAMFSKRTWLWPTLSAFGLIYKNLNANQPESLEPQSIRVEQNVQNEVIVPYAGNIVIELLCHCSRCPDASCDDENEPPRPPLTVSCSLAGPRRTMFKHQHAGALRIDRPQAHVRPLPAASKCWSRPCRCPFFSCGGHGVFPVPKEKELYSLRHQYLQPELLQSAEFCLSRTKRSSRDNCGFHERRANV